MPSITRSTGRQANIGAFGLDRQLQMQPVSVITAMARIFQLEVDISETDPAGNKIFEISAV
jgi:hypothetical protein